ncbi:MAG: GGDEF domain-containing protein [Phycisphaerales bacterium]|nr:GGDEF domain-containing protein [Phycisphaerales bacterium]
MNRELLEEILSCPSLPSLPAVAVRVIELTGSDDVSMKELAATIENDQALAAKVLRTVNSSFYGLRTRCATISKALVMLGLGPVKTLALGFSLVSTIGEQDSQFDYVSYWRRGLYTAVSSKLFAEAAKKKCSEEAFLGGLLQDVGVMALYRALGKRYLEVMEQAGGDHRKLVKFELTDLEVQHPDIGAMLTERWKLPQELVLPVKYHERPTAAPKECTDLVRLVGLGNLAHDVLSDSDPGPALRRLYQRAEQWFGLTASTVDGLLRRIAEAAKELSTLFKLDTGLAADAEMILTKASGQLLEITKNGGNGSQLLEGLQHDPLTGAVSREGFDAALREAFRASIENNEPMGLLELTIDDFKPIRQAAPDLADEALIGVTALLKKHFEPAGGVVCRVSDEVFAIPMSGVTKQSVARACEEFRADLVRASGVWLKGRLQGRSTFTASIGVALHEPDNSAFQSVEHLLTAATKGLQASRASGGNAVRVVSQKTAA